MLVFSIIMKIKLFFLLCISFSIAYPQQLITLSGKVINSNSQAIPFATVHFKNNHLGTMTNDEGYFNFNIESTQLPDSLRIQHLSYQTKNMWVEADTLEIEIILATQDFSIREIEIETFRKPDALVKKAIQSLDINYKQNTTYSKGFYQQIHRENGKYVRLIEALVTVQNANICERRKETQKEKFHINQLRRSYVYERNGDQHGDHLIDLFLANPIFYEKEHLLHLKNIASYYWEYDTDYDSLGYSKIIFLNKDWEGAKNYSGYLTINTSDYGIIEIVIESYPNNKTIDRNLEWQFQNGKYKATYQKIAHNYFLEKAEKWYNHKIYNKQFNRYDFVVEETFTWINWENYEDESSSYSFKKGTNLYSQHCNYDATSWDDIRIEPLDSLVIKDLEHIVSLDFQFENQ